MRERDEPGMYSVLVGRMSRLIDVLEPHQRNYHVALQVDIYWYIQKRKEVEVLVSRLSGRPCDKLEHYLHFICSEIARRIDRDEQIAHEHITGLQNASAKNTPSPIPHCSRQQGDLWTKTS